MWCDVALRIACISTDAAWHNYLPPPASLILMLLTVCEMETSSKYVPLPAYHTLLNQAKVQAYEDFLHHGLA